MDDNHDPDRDDQMKQEDREEEEPMMRLHTEKTQDQLDYEKRKSRPPRDNSADKCSCGCCTLKCQVITCGVLIYLLLAYYCVMLFFIMRNQYFDDYYFLVYMLFLLPITISAVLYIVYWCSPDCPRSRAQLQFAIACAGITALLIGTWVCLYIYAFYPEEGDELLVGMGPKAQEGEEETNYERQDKTTYFLINALPSFIAVLVFIFFWHSCRMWVKYNEEYEYST